MNGHDVQLASSPVGDIDEKFTDVSLEGEVSTGESAAQTPSSVEGSTDVTPPASPKSELNNAANFADYPKNSEPPAQTNTPSSKLANMKTELVHSTTESEEETFARLIKGIKEGTIAPKEVVTGVCHALVGGPFDLESKFIIRSSTSVARLVELTELCKTELQAELWSMFVAIARKSHRNLECCIEAELTNKVLERLAYCDEVVASLLIELLAVLTQYSVSVREMKELLKMLEPVETAEGQRCWRRHSGKLLKVLRQMPNKDGPDAFFSFTGSGGIALPPFRTWPYMNGWTFAAWIRLDPPSGAIFEREKPCIYSIKNAKGIGYSLNLLGNCLVVTSLKSKNGRGFARCVKRELTPRKWHHIAVAHVYSRWSKGEVQCYIDGQLADTLHDMQWLAHSANDQFDKCFIGAEDQNTERAFCGQMSAIYLFQEALTLKQVNSIYCLGANYQSGYQYEAESDLPDGYMRNLFDGSLRDSLFALYSPRHCDRTLALQCAPSSAYYVNIPHAVMRDGIKVVRTHSVHSSLHSVGGIQMLLPLFYQLDLPHADTGEVDFTLCASLLSVFVNLLQTSTHSQHQLLHSKGFLVISDALMAADRRHRTMPVLEAFISLGKQLLSSPAAGVGLLRQLFDFILFNSAIWVETPGDLQLRLYNYLANDFLANSQFVQILRRTTSILHLLHAIKYYYWLVDPRDRSGFEPVQVSQRPENADIVTIRASILLFIRKAIVKAQDQKDDELQALLNFVATVQENDNIYDVLHTIVQIVAEDPAHMIPAFDRKKAVTVVFKLLAADNELVRLPALKLLGYFLHRATAKRKGEVMDKQNLYTLLNDRLLLNARYLTMATYNTLFEILTEKMVLPVVYARREVSDAASTTFENPLILKVIANLIAQSEPCAQLMEVRKAFVDDMIVLCIDSRDNRRTILQMSVWQEWLMSLASVFPVDASEYELSNRVYVLFGLLLQHAIKYEYGGWRVWVDTMAIVHSKVSYEHYRRETTLGSGKAKRGYSHSQQSVECIVVDVVEELVDQVCHREKANSRTPTQHSSIYRTPEFRWSKIHVRLLSDMLSTIEKEVDRWRGNEPETIKGQQRSALLEAVNSGDNAIFVANVVHVISQLVDSLIMACGGLLPLLAAATSPNVCHIFLHKCAKRIIQSELDIVDSSYQGLPIETACTLMIRFVALADTFIFSTAIHFSDLEQEKNMPAGGILRQALRLVCTVAVRNMLASRLATDPLAFAVDEVALAAGDKMAVRNEAIRRFAYGYEKNADEQLIALLTRALALIDKQSLLQDVDLVRLKGCIYRDMEEHRQAQFLALAVTYFISVLMVSRYRDILEPPSSPSPFFNSRSMSRDDVIDKQSIGAYSSDSGANNATATASAKIEDEQNASPAQSHSPPQQQISSINVDNGAAEVADADAHKPADLAAIQQAPSAIASRERQAQLSTTLQRALATTAPLLREIFTDFRSYMQRTLLGTHSQEIMNDARVMATLRNQQGSVIELVMLLCSQEWQTSLQKHAGLAFIELVNEGRLMAHATRDHILRVANEADFILNRLRAEDVTKHAAFEEMSASTTFARRDEEATCDRLIAAARRRDHAVAERICERVLNILRSANGAWANAQRNKITYCKLDVWEDDSRRRKRFVPDAQGCDHADAAPSSRTAPPVEAVSIDAAREQLLAKLVASKIIEPPRHAVPTSTMVQDLIDEQDIAAMLNGGETTDEPEHTSLSTRATLLAPGVALPGVISITHNELFFDCDETHPNVQKLDARFHDGAHCR